MSIFVFFKPFWGKFWQFRSSILYGLCAFKSTFFMASFTRFFKAFFTKILTRNWGILTKILNENLTRFRDLFYTFSRPLLNVFQGFDERSRPPLSQYQASKRIFVFSRPLIHIFTASFERFLTKILHVFKSLFDENFCQLLTTTNFDENFERFSRPLLNVF